jgi:hypothetical protein
MKVVIIPAWLKRKLDANRLPLTVVLDTKRLINILTPEDLFFLLNIYIGDDISGDYKVIREDFPNTQLVTDLLDSFNPGELEILSGQLRAEESALLRHHLTLGDVLDSEEHGVVNIHNYDTVMLQPEVAAVVVSPNQSTGYSNESITAFLEVLQGQMSFKDTTKLECFKLFIRKV